MVAQVLKEEAMDELELLRRFREGVRDPEPERVMAARFRLVQAVGAEQSPQGSLKQFRPSVRRWAIPAAAAAAAVALAVALPVVLPRGGGGGAEPAAAAALRRVAAIAVDQPAEPAPGPGQYLYTKSRSVRTSLYVPGHGLANFSFTLPQTRELWKGPDGSGRELWSTGHVTFPRPKDRAAWLAAGSPDLEERRRGDQTYGPGELQVLDLSKLPTDPEKLLTLIEERRIIGGDPADWVTFQIIGELLHENYVRPALRAALYEAAAHLPGVELVGRVEDEAGRPGVAVAYWHEGVRDELIFDQRTARLLAYSSVLVDPDEVGLEVSAYPGTILAYAGDPGTVVYSTVYLVSGVVDSTRARP